MVNTARRLTPALVGALLLTTSLSAKDTADYRIGDVVAEDIVTPVPLMVVDPAATIVLKEKESLRIPVVFRFNETAAPAVEAELRDAFTLARSNFLFLMNLSFHHTRLEADALETEQFQKLLASFKKRDKNFPLTTDLAESWARGESGLVLQTAVIARVRAAMERPIRFNNLTNAPKLGSQIRLVAVTNDEQTITLAAIKERGRNTARTNMLTVSRARLALEERFSPEEAEMAKFATRWLRPNCFVEPELTLAARARQTDPLFVADNYSAGQVIARAGQALDGKMMAALGQLQEKTAAGRLQQQVVQEKNQSAQIRRRTQWLGAGLAVTTLLLITVWMTRRRNASLLPVRAGAALVPRDENTASWRQRALVAEQQVEQAHTAVRAGALAQLARLFREKFVRGLIAQRGSLLNAQQSAAAEMAEMEQRLNDLHAPLQDRLHAYERRIADLEQALAVKGEENRELIKAKIQLIRHQMEAERTRNRLEFN